MTWEIWLSLFGHFVMLSLLAVGGAVTTAPDMQRYVVEQRNFITDTQFASSIAIAQAAPGPNVLFMALIGWQIGFTASNGSYWHALAGLLATFIGIIVPSSTLTLAATQWLHRNADHLISRSSKAALSPISIALLLATAWVLVAVHNNPAKDWPLWLFSLVCMSLAWRTKLHLLWLLGTGALLGIIGWI